MAVVTIGNESFGDLLKNVVAASKIPAKGRTVGVKPMVEKLTTLSYDEGVLPNDLSRLVGLVTTRSHLDQASLGSLIRSLYPAGKVSSEAVLAVVGCLGHGELKPALAVQSVLLRWLILVYHVLDSHAVLSRCYAVLFNLLDTAAIRPQLCHLLALITRRRHVRPFRIQLMLDLSRQVGHDPALVGLLRVYKNYYPEVIVGDVTRGKASPFKYPDPEWRERLDEIQAAHRLQQDRAASDAGPQNGFRVNHRLNRQRGTLVPSVQTLHAQEDSVTLEEIDNAEQFVQNLEKIELPNQLVAVLADPLLQKLLALRPDSDADGRVSNWLEACVADAADGAFVDGGGALLDLVEIVYEHAVQTKTLHRIFDPLLQKLYEVWNGRDRRDVVLSTMSFLPFGIFDEIYRAHLQPLEGKVLDNSPDSQLALLGFYTQLLRCWTTVLLSLEDSIPEHTPDTLSALIKHVNSLSLTLVQTSPALPTHVSILVFYSQAASLLSHRQLLQHVYVAAPPTQVVYTLAFSPSPAVFSTLCSVLASYKRGLEAAMAVARPRRPLRDMERRQIATFNGFWMDVANLVFRGRAFDRAAGGGTGCGVADGVVEALGRWVARGQDRDVDVDPVRAKEALAGAMGLSRHPTLCLQSMAHVLSLEEEEFEDDDDGGEEGFLRPRHAGPVTVQSLARLARDGGLALSWQDYRLGVLRHLEGVHLGGVPELLFQTMKALRGAHGGGVAAAAGGGGGVAG